MTILRRVGFSRAGKPFLEYTDGSRIWQSDPFVERDIALSFAMNQRFCVGWHSMEAGEDYPCPDSASVDSAYDQCMACTKRTGFNPAFYHATSISEQQQARNAEPHIVYLAYFSPEVIKVGISYKGRGIARLLEQGARAAVVLAECKTALIARGYEEKITGMYAIRDNVQLAKKAELARMSFDAERASQTLSQLAVQLGEDVRVSFNTEVQLLDSYYFVDAVPNLVHSCDLTKQHAIAGTTVGMLGSLLYTCYDDTIVYLPLKKYTGYRVAQAVPVLDLGVQQMTLF